jgi:hypothetical protein
VPVLFKQARLRDELACRRCSTHRVRVAPDEERDAYGPRLDGRFGSSCLVEVPEGPRARVGSHRQQSPIRGLPVLLEQAHLIDELACRAVPEGCLRVASNEEW